MTVIKFSECMAGVNEWMAASRLRLNPSKTQIMWLGSRHQLECIAISNIPFLSTILPVVSTARDLGIVLDSQLTMSSHVNAVCRSSYCQLRQLRSVIRSVSVDAARTLVQAFVASRIDYCNSLLYGVADGLVQRLQSVQNAAARLVTGTSRRDHITPILRQLHWLPLRQRIEFKVAVLTFRSLHQLAPAYLTDYCQFLSDSGRRQLRSATAMTCIVPHTHNSFGDRSFAVAGPRLWNSLPAQLRLSDSLNTFRQNLKTYLFGRSSS